MPPGRILHKWMISEMAPLADFLCVLAFRAASATLTGGAGTACVWLQPSPSRSPMHGWWTRCRLGTSGIQGAGKRTSDQPNPRKCTPPAPETSLNLRRTRGTEYQSQELQRKRRQSGLLEPCPLTKRRFASAFAEVPAPVFDVAIVAAAAPACLHAEISARGVWGS